MDENKEITLVRTAGGDYVEAGTTKIQEIENKISEIETNLTGLSDISGNAVTELLQLAVQSQNPAYYDVLSKLITAAAKANQVAILAVQSRANLYTETRGEGGMASPEDETNVTNVTNNNLIMTTTDLLDHIIQSKKDKLDDGKTKP